MKRSLVGLVGLVLLLSGLAATSAEAAPTRTVTFVVRTTSGLPVVGSYVGWSLPDGSASSVRRRTTDGAGRVVFPGVPLAEVRLDTAAQLGADDDGPIGGRVASTQPILGTSSSTVTVGSAGEIAVDVGEPIPMVGTEVAVVMPDGTPVPGAELSSSGMPAFSRIVGSSRWVSCPVIDPCSDFSYVYSATASYVTQTDIDGRATIWHFDTAEEGCPFRLEYSDGEVRQVQSFDCAAGGPSLVLELPYMPVVLVPDNPPAVPAGDGVVVPVEVVDELGDPLPGASVSLRSVTSADGRRTESGTACRVTTSGRTDARGRLRLRLCPVTSGLWRVDGPGVVGSRSFPIRVTPAAPRGLTAKRRKATTLVSWEAPLGLGSARVVRYRLTAAPGGRRCTTTRTSCRVRGLRPGTSYRLRLRTVTTSGKVPVAALRLR